MAKGAKLPFDIDEVMRRIRAARGRRAGRGDVRAARPRLRHAVPAARRVHHLDPHDRRGVAADGARAARAGADAGGRRRARRRATSTRRSDRPRSTGRRRRRSTRSRAEWWRSSDGELPADAEVLQSFAGVGPKCANLALGVARNVPRISVDVHVWRVVNRWGYVDGTHARGDARARSSACCRRSTGSRSTGGSCRSASTSARGSGRSARRVPCSSTAGRWG